MSTRLVKLAKEFNARFAAVADASRLGRTEATRWPAHGIAHGGAGESAIIEAAERPADWVMAAVSGAAGLKPALAAADRGATMALANKECLVCAGDFFMQRAPKAGACILPADSEHNALFQALASGNREEPGARDHHRVRRSVPHLARRATSSRRHWRRR